ncbi:uncharacterized protein LOC143258121 [Tachypleus tridentatus]|uniref:uncharacterized protein LOC143258121 n=1 Tax=Tachypleus tridentatus TaxID=6853 RepID=UPI003FD5DC05
MKTALSLLLCLYGALEALSSFEFFKFEKQAEQQKLHAPMLVPTLQQPNVRWCVAACSKMSDCGGFNYRANTLECDLLPTVNGTLKFITTVGNAYYGKITSCDVIPCQNGGTCEDISPTLVNGTFRDHQCTCRRGYCGLECEEPGYRVLDNIGLPRNDITPTPANLTLEGCLQNCLELGIVCKAAVWNKVTFKCYRKRYAHTSEFSEPLLNDTRRAYIYIFPDCSGTY